MDLLGFMLFQQTNLLTILILLIVVNELLED